MIYNPINPNHIAIKKDLIRYVRCSMDNGIPIIVFDTAEDRGNFSSPRWAFPTEEDRNAMFQLIMKEFDAEDKEGVDI